MSAYLLDKIERTGIIENASLDHFLEWASGLGLLLDCAPTGSRVICCPAVLNTDADFLVLVTELNAAGAFFLCEGWSNCFEAWKEKDNTDPREQQDSYTVELEGGARFQAWRRGEVNVILTDDVALHMRSRAATLLAQQLALNDKDERISLFRCIKFGETYTGRLK